MCVSSANSPFELFLTCCPGIHSSGCKENNEVASKIGAQIVLRGVLGMPLNSDDVPFLEDAPSYPSTIIEAPSVKTVENVEVERDS